MSKCRTLFPRLALIATVAVVAAEAACRDTPTAPSANSVNVSPAVTTAGDSSAPEISFLAPLGPFIPKRLPRGDLDTTLAPKVAICRLAGDSCTADTLAHFTSDSGTTDGQRVRLTDKAYVASWDLSTIPADTSAGYRIIVALGDTMVGYTDARVVPAGYRPPPSDTARFAFVTALKELSIRFQIFMPPESLTVFAEPGVHGSLVSGSALHRHGERVSYQFEADSGYTNVLVTVDQAYLPRRGSITMNRAHVLVASADRDAAVAHGDEWMLLQGRALLRSATPVRAAQQFLNDIAATEDTSNLTERLAHVERALVQADPAALRSLDLALAGHAFFAGSGHGVAEPVVAPPPGGGGDMVASNVLLGPAALPRLLTSQSIGLTNRIRYEPLTIAYVNGVLTSPYGALFNADAVARMARASTWNAEIPFEVRLIYNSTAAGDLGDPNDRCVIELARESQGLGINALPLYLDQCEKRTSPATTKVPDMLAKLADFAEAGLQLSNIITRLPLPHPADADSVAAITARWRAAGRHVVFVPHSQGNLMVQQGVDILARKGLYHPATDSTCIGAVPLAAPTSDNWPISSRHLTGIVAAHDAILLLQQNHFPQVNTPLGDSADAALGQWRRLSQVRGLAGALSIQWAVRIHELVGGYLEQEPIRTHIQQALVHSYKSCALGEIAVSPQRMNLVTGASGTFSTKLLDLNADPLDGSRVVTWKGESGSDWGQAVSVFPDGRVQALYVGGTAARASTSTLIATFPVAVEPAPLPVAVAESLSAIWIPLPGATVSPEWTMPSGPPPAYVDMPTPWNGDNCIVRQDITVQPGVVGHFSKQCTAKYRVTAGPVPNATRYEAHFFEINHTNRLFTVAASTPLLQGEVSGPTPSATALLPGPTLLDRVNVTAWDSAGHLLSSGSTCAHGCVGWPGFP